MPALLARVPFSIWLALAALLAGWQCIFWQFGADDLAVVRRYTDWVDESLRVDWHRVARDFVGPWGGNDTGRYWRPIVSTSLALDFEIFGLRAGWTAAINLVLHFVSGLLVWRLGLRILPGRRAAMLAALLFVTTPLAHETLAWVVGRCALTTVFGLAAALAFVRAEDRATSGVRRFAPALAWMILDLATMESALAWILFPPLCVAISNGFRPHYEGLARDFVRDAIPFAILAGIYLLMRVIILGGITGQYGTGVSANPLDNLAALGHAFVGSICPLDTSFLPDGPARAVFRALCFAPWIVGLAAPLHFKDARSRGYRRAMLLLLAFWIFARLPGLTVLSMGPELEVSRTAYYAYAPLALCTGMLASTVRYARWGTVFLALCFGMGLSHRLGDRAAWAEAGLRARLVAFDAAEQRGATGDGTETRPIAILSMLDGKSSAPAVHVGELPLALFPPLVPKRAHVVSVYGFAPQGEPYAGAWLAKELGGVLTIAEPSDPRARIETEWTESFPFLDTDFEVLPAPGLRETRTSVPDLVVPSWVREDGAVLVLSAGLAQIVVEVDASATSWPPPARAALLQWREHGDVGASFAGHLERRADAGDPLTVTARTRVFVGAFRR